VWDVTTSTRLEPEVLNRALWRLLAWAWLDAADVYGIRPVGIYLARHGVAVSWGLTAYASSMLSGTGRDDTAREQILGLTRRLAADDAPPPPAWVPRAQVLYGR
jgi:hypothetical protein